MPPVYRHLFVAGATAVALWYHPGPARSADYSFLFPTGGSPPYALRGSGAWSDAAQWSGGTLPDVTAVIEVSLPQSYSYNDGSGEPVTEMLYAAELNHDSGDTVIHSIAQANDADILLSAGTLTLLNASIVSGAYTQRGGQLAGAGSLALNGSASLAGGTMTGTGVTTLTGTGAVVGSLGLEGGASLSIALP